MKRTLLFAALVAASIFTGAASAAGFTYHGNLRDAGKPANGTYDIELTLYSAPTGGSVVGGPLTIYAVPVRDGSFSTEADFGPLAKSFSQAYVNVKVRSTGGTTYADLDTRTAVTPDTNSACPGAWSLDGNAGNPAGSYLGTGDNQPIVFKVNGTAAGSITPGKGVAFGQGGFGAAASGEDGFATGEGVFASGMVSFAGGFGATVAQSGSYMWGDSNTGGGITATTAANQYIVRAGGGVGINGVPRDNATELTIYPSLLNGGNYSNIFLGNAGRSGGILVSAGDESTATSNDAGFYVDQYNGTTQTRRLQVAPSGGVGINTNPLSSSTELTITGSPTAADTNVDLAMIPRGSSWGYDVGVSGTAQADDGFFISQTDGSSYTNRFSILNGHVGINGTTGPDGYITVTNTGHTFGAVNFVTNGGGSVGLVANADASNANMPYFTIFTQPPSGTPTGIIFDVSSTFHTGLNNANASPSVALQVGNTTTNGGGAYLSNGGVWTNASSRTFKDGFAAIDALDVLAKVASLPVQTWFYKNDHEEGRHMGPFAEDFAHAFALGNDEKHIGTIDENGVALAAIQGLNKKVENENSTLQEQNAALQSKLDEVLARLSKLEAGKGQ